MWEKDVSINEVKQLRGKVDVFFGVGAIGKINDISKELKDKNIDKVAIVTGKSSYRKTGAWDHVENALKNNEIQFVHYDGVTANPTTTQVDEATKLAVELGAKAVIGIGGGSAIDAAKSVAIMALNTDYSTADLYEYKFTPSEALPMIAINTTHGTGSEGNRFAVVSILEKEYKPAIAYEMSYPMYSIDDPALMTSLPKSQTLYTAIDAVNHVFESCTTIATTPYSILLAEETIRLVNEYLPKALENGEDLEARYYLAYASLLAGMSFDNGMLHLTHALEHPLSSVQPDLAHGLGLAVLLPAIAKQTYRVRPETLADVLKPIIPGLKGTAEEAEKVAEELANWQRSLGVTETLSTLGFKEEDIDHLVDLAFTTPSLELLLGCSPIPVTKELVATIYRESL